LSGDLAPLVILSCHVSESRRITPQIHFSLLHISSYLFIPLHTENALGSIRQNGLKSKDERTKAGLKAGQENGAAFGDGVYIAIDHVSSSRFGDTCLIVGYLLGHMQDFGGHGGRPVVKKTAGKRVRAGSSGDNASEILTVDTIKASATWRVLKKSSQVVPLLQIPKAPIFSNPAIANPAPATAFGGVGGFAAHNFAAQQLQLQQQLAAIVQGYGQQSATVPPNLTQVLQQTQALIDKMLNDIEPAAPGWLW
jgi:hypothetical protein